MPFDLLFTDEASSDYDTLEKNNALLRHFKAVRKALGYLEINPRHPSLNTHQYDAINGPSGKVIFEAYAENKTPTAYRIFWYYGPGKHKITIVAITPHP